MYKKHSHSHSSRKTLLLIATGALLVLLIAGGTIVYLNRDALFSNSQSADGEGDSSRPASIEKIEVAQRLSVDGDVESASQYLDESIESAGTDEEKAAYYNQKASVIFSTDKNAAFEYSKRAAELSPGVGNFTATASLAEQAGNTAAAIEFYEKALAETNKIPVEEQNPATYPSAYYERKIATLRGQ